MDSVAERAISSLPESLREGVLLWLGSQPAALAQLPDKYMQQLVPLVASSEFAANVITRNVEWFVQHVGEFSAADPEALLSEFEADFDDTALADDIRTALRQFRNRFLLQVLWCDFHGVCDLDQTLRSLSLLADRTLAIATRAAEIQYQARYGTLRNSEGLRIPLIILGMGKLGGEELNFSSDIDLIFCYPEGGETDGAKTISAEQYFDRLSKLVISMIDDVTADGFVFRVDTRLRPFGDSGPPVVSFAGLESYLLQHGRDWERYAYVKARVVGLRPDDEVVEDLYRNLILPFVYRRYLDFGVFESVREMQRMIADEVRRRDLADNVKLGPGGIREVEFIVQALQLVRGGSEPALQSRSLQRVLPRLVEFRALQSDEADKLRLAYRFLRRLENFVQAIRDQQTHDLPVSDTDRARLCVAMHQPTWEALCEELQGHRDVVSEQFAAIAIRGEDDQSAQGESLGQLWESGADAGRWTDALPEISCPPAAALAEKIVKFATSSAVQQIDTISRRRLRRFIPLLITQVMSSSRPLAALSRTLLVVERVLRRSAYLALLNENEAALQRLVGLCERSQYIAEQIARYPALLDELLDPSTFSGDVTKADLQSEMRSKLGSEEEPDSEAHMQAIAQFQRATIFRIAVEDFNARLPLMKVSDGLTWLAELILDEALRIAWRDLTKRHGVPRYKWQGNDYEAGFGIVAYGKLGGLELSYGSDLDIVFLHDSRGDEQRTDGAKPLENVLFFGRLVRRLVHFLTTQTGSGELYEVDTRLRPDGRSGVLVSSIEAFERYQENNAWTWEHQALLRARAVAGSRRIGEQFERVRRQTLQERVHVKQLRADVISMRKRMRKELDRSDGEQFDLKHGAGGIGDIEFLVQYLVLRNAAGESDVLTYSDNIRQLDALVSVGVIEQSVGAKLQDIYKKYRLEVHHKALDGQVAVCSTEQFGEERAWVIARWDDWLA